MICVGKILIDKSNNITKNFGEISKINLEKLVF